MIEQTSWVTSLLGDAADTEMLGVELSNYLLWAKFLIEAVFVSYFGARFGYKAARLPCSWTLAGGRWLLAPRPEPEPEPYSELEQLTLDALRSDSAFWDVTAGGVLRGRNCAAWLKNYDVEVHADGGTDLTARVGDRCRKEIFLLVNAARKRYEEVTEEATRRQLVRTLRSAGRAEALGSGVVHASNKQTAGHGRCDARVGS